MAQHRYCEGSLKDRCIRWPLRRLHGISGLSEGHFYAVAHIQVRAHHGLELNQILPLPCRLPDQVDKIYPDRRGRYRAVVDVDAVSMHDNIHSRIIRV